MTIHYVLVGCGGALGAILRVVLMRVLPPHLLGIPFPIVSINILGCLGIGFLARFLSSLDFSPEPLKYFLISGFLGGFTTFSAFALDFGNLIENQDYFLAFKYVFLSVSASLIAFFIGLKIMDLFSGP